MARYRRKGMLGFYNRLQEVKENYLCEIVHEAKKYKNIVIYGAGRVAKPIIYRFKEEKITITFFAVSDMSINEKDFFGIQVKQIEDVNLDSNDTLIIIAVKYVWANDVLEKIKENGYGNYIFPPKEIDLFAREQSDEVYRPVMEITLKVGCKINCKYCPQELFLKKYFSDKKREEYLSLENFKKCLLKLPRNTIISFCGFVEPFLHPQAIEMIEYTWQQGYKIKLYTTLVGLTKAGFERIRNIPFHYVVLHTPDEQGYANIPMTEEYFEILDMALEQKRLDGSRFIDTANCQGIPHKDVLKHTKGKLRIMSELYDRAGNLEKDDCLKSVGEVSGPIYCVRVNDRLNNNVLLPDGTVLLCDFDFGMKHVLGNLLEESYEEIMSGNNMQQIVQALDNDECSLLCRKCNYAINVDTIK
jgi:hypothetical protein